MTSGIRVPAVMLCLGVTRGGALDGLAWIDESVSWMHVVTSSFEARKNLVSVRELKEVWVVGSADMDPLNLAAGLQKLRSDTKVFLLSREGTGSFLSRCAAAGVVPCVGELAVRNLYGRAKSLYGDVPVVREGGLSSEAHLPDVVSNAEGSSSIRRASLPVVRGYSSSATPSRNHVGVGLIDDVSDSGSLSRSELANVASSRLRSRPEDGFVLSVVSGSGGSGKSSVSVLAGVCSQMTGTKTVIVDADFQFGDVSWLMGRKNAVDSLSLLRHGSVMSELAPDGDIPAVVRPPDGLECSEEVFGNVVDLIDMARKSFDVVIVNTGSFWMDAHLDLLEMSNHVLFLADQRPSSLRACSRAVDLCIRCGIPTQRFSFALNRCGKQALLSTIDASCALKGAKVRELRDGGREVSELLGAGLPLELATSKNVFVQDVSKMANEILPLKKRVLSGPASDSRARKERKGFLPARKGRAA